MTRLRLIKEKPSPEGYSRYYHTGGFRIERVRRSWSERNGNQVGGGVALYWWTVYDFRRSGVERGCALDDFRTLREARAWCDAQSCVEGV